LLAVNENREQTQAIHRMQREAQTLDVLLRRREREEILKLHDYHRRCKTPRWIWASDDLRDRTIVGPQTPASVGTQRRSRFPACSQCLGLDVGPRGGRTDDRQKNRFV
jgi:hypothetical protein